MVWEQGKTVFSADSYNEKNHWVKVDGLKNFGT